MKYLLVFGWACVLALTACNTNSAAENTAGNTEDNGTPSSSSSASEVTPPSVNPECRFKFGADWRKNAQSAQYRGLDHIGIWVGDNPWYNTNWEGKMVDMAIEVGATPLFYAYVIAEFGKDRGLADCDLSKTPNHCTDGARIIREYWQDSIIIRYRDYAQGLHDQLLNYSATLDADTFEVIWLIEPDFYQYSESSSLQNLKYQQSGGGIPDAEMGRMFTEITDSIHAYLPAAKISLDISPWIKDQPSWYANFDLDRIDYAHTSGGRTLAASANIRGSEAKWATVHALVGKPIIADAGYGASGTGLGHDEAWDLAENITARMADGVVAITQMDATLDYPLRVAELSRQLGPIAGCPVP